MKFIGFSVNIIFILFSLWSCNSFQNDGFTVLGRKLIDAKGNEFIIQGVNNPNIWYPKKAYEALPAIAENNVNTVRIVWQTHGELSLLDSIIAKCIELKMIPMLELHNVTGNSTAVALLQMAGYYVRPDVKAVLDKYKEYILINIANEWGDHNTTGKYWCNSYKRVIDRIRNAGYETTIVIDAPGWGQNITPILDYANELTEYDTLNNILYSVHMYGSWNDEDTIREMLQEAYSKEIPLIVGEFGYNFQNGNNNLKCKVNQQVILEKCYELGYGILPWSWTGNSGGNEWLDLVNSNDWETLTPWGKMVFEGKYGIKNNAKKASVFIK